MVFEVCACIKLVVVIVMIFMFIEVDNIVVLFFCLSKEEFVMSMAESTESVMCCLLSALGEGILELIDLRLDIISELSEFSLTGFSFRVDVEKSSILGGSEFINSLVCESLEIGDFGGEVSSHCCLRLSSFLLCVVD